MSLPRRLDASESFAVGELVWVWYRKRLHVGSITSAEWLHEFGRVWWQTRVYQPNHRRWTLRRRWVLVQRSCTTFEVEALQRRGVVGGGGELLNPAAPYRRACGGAL